MPVVLDHAVGIRPQTGDALALLLQMGVDVHPGGVPPEEERLVLLLGFFHEAQRLLGDFLVDRFHALLAERAGGHDLLRAVRVGPAVQHAARLELLDHFRILEVVRVLELFLRIEVVERAEELVEAVRGRQGVVGVTEVVLAELTGLVALPLEQFGDGHVPRLEPFLRAGQADLEHAGAEADLAGNEACPTGGAALLPVPVGEHRAFLRDAIDVRRLVAHHAQVVGADVPVPDVISPDESECSASLRPWPCLLHDDLEYVRRPCRRTRMTPRIRRPQHAVTVVPADGDRLPPGVSSNSLITETLNRRRSEMVPTDRGQTRKPRACANGGWWKNLISGLQSMHAT